MADLGKTAKTLIKALNSKGDKLLFSRKEFMGKECMPHNLYSISRAIWDDEKGKFVNHEIYKSTSMVRIVLYLNDLWCLANDKPLPMGNKLWNGLRPNMEEF